MPGPLPTAPVTDEQRRANDRHRLFPVLGVLGVLALYAYLFTPAADRIGIPRPGPLLARAGFRPTDTFTSGGLVDLPPTIVQPRLETAGERGEAVGIAGPPSPPDAESAGPGTNFLLFLGTAAGAFLCAYFLPLRWKRPSILVWASLAILALYGGRAIAGLLLAHTLVYVILHPKWGHSAFPPGAFSPLKLLGQGAGCPLLAGALVFPAFVRVPRGPEDVAWVVLGAIVALLVYRRLVLPALARPRTARFFRSAVVQSALITVCAAALAEGITHRMWIPPLGLALFFWQMARLMLYRVDLEDGLVPAGLPFTEYLSVFLTPGVVPVWIWGSEIGQGYSYTANSFLCEDKNRIVRSGIRILLVALVYLSFWYWGVKFLTTRSNALGIETFHGSTEEMIDYFMSNDGQVGTLSVLVTTLIDLTYWTATWAGLLHLKVGLWRICGFRTDPYFDRPWLSTNLVACWTRFTYHYREYLVRVFYYPVFFRVRGSRTLRIVLATVAAVGVGNMVWRHLGDELYYEGAKLEVFPSIFETWPYYLLLSGGIALTEIYFLARRRRRRPWTPGPRVALDVLAAYCTVQFYAMIHIFIEERGAATNADLLRLFLRGFGIRY